MAASREGREETEAQWGEWMAAAQEGDRDAYEHLLLAILPVLRAIVFRRIRDDATAEDTVQNILLSIHRARHTYRPERPFGPWMRAVARNAVTDALRAQTRRRGRELPLEEPDQVEAPPQELPQDAPLSPAMSRALAALPPAQRQAVELIHIHQLSVAEAAVRADTTPGALKVRAHRGYQALRKQLGGPDK